MKLIIASIIVFSLVILFVFALFPADISVSRILEMKCPAERVQKEIADLRTWKNWNLLLANAAAPENTGLSPELNDSNYLSRGALSVTLVKSTAHQIIARWQRGDNSFIGDYTITDVNGRIVVQWTLHFHLKWYPWEKLASMFYEKELGPKMEESLLNLQKQLLPA